VSLLTSHRQHQISWKSSSASGRDNSSPVAGLQSGIPADTSTSTTPPSGGAQTSRWHAAMITQLLSQELDCDRKEARHLSPARSQKPLDRSSSVSRGSRNCQAWGHGYVLKSDAALDLLDAIRCVREGNQFVSQRLLAQGWRPDA